MKNKSLFKIITATSLGGGLEMYDFVIYVFFAPILAKLFFPQQDAFVEMIVTFGIFAIGYFARPLGALLFGYIGDKVGRRKTLIASIIVMALATLSLGMMPTYASLGYWAALLLVIARFVQGLAIGGELPGAITYVSECSDAHQRGANCAWVFFTVNMGIVLASFVGFLLTELLTQQQLVSWGWRVAFFFGLVVAFVAYYLRRQAIDSPLFVKIRAMKKEALAIDYRSMALSMLRGVGVMWVFAVGIAQTFLYMPTYLHTVLGMDYARAELLNTIGLVVLSCSILVMGRWSDRIGRKKIVVWVSLLLLLLSYPLYYFMQMGYVVVPLLVLAVLVAGIVGVVPSMLSELAPTQVRYRVVAIVYNIGFAVFGGLTPTIATVLAHYGSTLVAINMMVAALVGLISVQGFKEMSGQPLE